MHGSWNGTHFGDQTWCKCMVILVDFLYNSALFGLVTSLSLCLCRGVCWYIFVAGIIYNSSILGLGMNEISKMVWDRGVFVQDIFWRDCYLYIPLIRFWCAGMTIPIFYLGTSLGRNDLSWSSDPCWKNPSYFTDLRETTSIMYV